VLFDFSKEKDFPLPHIFFSFAMLSKEGFCFHVERSFSELDFREGIVDVSNLKLTLSS